MCMSSPKPPKALPPPPATEAPTLADVEVQGKHGKELKRQRAAMGKRDTILTSNSGLNTQASTGKTILGGAG